MNCVHTVYNGTVKQLCYGPGSQDWAVGTRVMVRLNDAKVKAKKLCKAQKARDAVLAPAVKKDDTNGDETLKDFKSKIKSR